MVEDTRTEVQAMRDMFEWEGGYYGLTEGFIPPQNIKNPVLRTSYENAMNFAEQVRTFIQWVYDTAEQDDTRG